MCFRRFVNLVSSDGLKCVYSLRRIDMSRFFLPAKNSGGCMLGRDPPPPPMEGDCSLPEPIMNFYSPERHNHFGTMDFMFVDNKLVATDGTGGAFMYDTDKDAVRSLPVHQQLKQFAFSVAAGNNLYNIDSITNGNGSRKFEALLYTNPTPSEQGNWHWHALPPPPHCVPDGGYDNTCIDSGAVDAGGSLIWFTARGRDGFKSSTYSFDRKRLVWSEPVDWVLPFDGCAEYIPDLGRLWFGISSKDHGNVLCASDLSAVSPEQPPSVTALLDDDMAGAAEPSDLVTARSVYLGSRKFCIARFFNVSKLQICPETQVPDEVDDNFVVLTGVEVVINGKNHLQLVKHHSERYELDGFQLHWVL